MKQQVGIWIDHKEAFLVFLDERTEGMKEPVETEKTQHIESGMDKHGRFSGHVPSADDQRDRQIASHLGKYFDTVISCIPHADSILLFGPGEAKGELQKRLVDKKLGEHIVGVETADKMSEHQIVAKVRQHYEK